MEKMNVIPSKETAGKMSLQLILGPMFAGKSSELLGTVRKYNAIGWPILVITHCFDKRYGKKPEVVSHDSERCPAIAMSDFYGVFDLEDYKNARLVIIEEAQFFTALKDFVLTAVERDSKDIICVGLDGDAERRPFGQLLELIPFCDSVVKRHAFCKRCKEPTPALFSYRIIQEDSQVLVGGAETYEPLCRKHYLNYGS
jgi:thymidine kinase